MTNDTFTSRSELPDIYTGIILTALSLSGILENGCVIYLSLRSSQTYDTTMKIITHLAVTDLGTALAVGLDAIFILGNISHEIGCFTVLMIEIYMIFVSQAVLLITTFDRYIAICHTILYPKTMTESTLHKMLALAWSLPAPIALIEFIGFNNWEADITCSYPNLLHRWVYLTNSTIIVFLMASTSLVYIQVLKKAIEFRRRFRPAQIHGVNAATLRVKLRKRAIRNGTAMGIVTLAFIICWLPFHVYQYQFGMEFEPDSSIIMITGGLGLLNFNINPFLYAWQKEEIRIEATKMFKCLRNKQRGGMVTISDGLQLQVQSACDVSDSSTASTPEDAMISMKNTEERHFLSNYTQTSQSLFAINDVTPFGSSSLPSIDIAKSTLLAALIESWV